MIHFLPNEHKDSLGFVTYGHRMGVRVLKVDDSSVVPRTACMNAACAR
jgi:hypothetical protein